MFIIKKTILYCTCNLILYVIHAFVHAVCHVEVSGASFILIDCLLFHSPQDNPNSGRRCRDSRAIKDGEWGTSFSLQAEVRMSRTAQLFIVPTNNTSFYDAMCTELCAVQHCTIPIYLPTGSMFATGEL
jgi:hypothetical protein